MALFFGISPGEERTAPGIRVAVTADGERVWMHGKWLDLGREHGMVWYAKNVSFARPDGAVRRLGQFPAWVVQGTGRRAPAAAMFSVTQFRGGLVVVDDVTYPVAR